MAKHINTAVTQEEDNPVPKEILAQSIVKIAEASNSLLRSGLNQTAIVALIKDSTGISKKTINQVLTSICQLREDYCHD